MKKSKENFWIPYADLMTILMVIFLFIALSYMGLLQEKIKGSGEIKESLYKDLKQEFKPVETAWNIEVKKDLSIRFKDADALYGGGSGNPTPQFINVLNKFIPKYLKVISKPEYRKTIEEVRIEGHTGTGEYKQTILLSQQRANSVLFYITNHPDFRGRTSEEKRTLENILTTSGYGQNRTLDTNGNPHKVTGLPSTILSRRVEFRIVTDNEKVIKELTEIKQ